MPTTEIKRVLSDEEREEMEQRYVLLAREHVARGNEPGFYPDNDARFPILNHELDLVTTVLGRVITGRIYRGEDSKYLAAHDAAMDAGATREVAHYRACAAMARGVKTWMVTEDDVMIASWEVATLLYGSDDGTAERDDIEGQIQEAMTESFTETEGRNMFHFPSNAGYES
jgi:hypothetical protein